MYQELISLQGFEQNKLKFFFKQKYCIAGVQAAPRFLVQEFGKSNISYISCTRFYLRETEISVITFAALGFHMQHLK
jgi:hypothetical protein